MNATAAMQRAIEVSQFGLGKTKGNPIVGAVIFDESGIISEGFHQSGPHAEVVAIENAKRDLTGASIAIRKKRNVIAIFYRILLSMQSNCANHFAFG